MRAESIRAVAAAAAVYFALVPVAFLLLVLTAGAHPAFTLILGLLSVVVTFAAVAVGSIRIARVSGDKDILLPLLAVWLGWVSGNLLVHGVFSGARSMELLAALVRPLSLGLLVPTTQAVSQITLFELGGTQFGVAVPWIVFVVYTAVFWSRRRARDLEAQSDSWQA